MDVNAIVNRVIDIKNIVIEVKVLIFPTKK